MKPRKIRFRGGASELVGVNPPTTFTTDDYAVEDSDAARNADRAETTVRTADTENLAPMLMELIALMRNANLNWLALRLRVANLQEAMETKVGTLDAWEKLENTMLLQNDAPSDFSKGITAFTDWLLGEADNSATWVELTIAKNKVSVSIDLDDLPT